MLDEGADILDLGAESTRPGSRGGHADAAVSSEEEQTRLLPVLEGVLRARPGVIVSVDTYKAPTARAALRAGAEIINDVSGFSWDASMALVCSQARAGLVLMHTRGRPEEWRAQDRLDGEAVLESVRSGLRESLQTARAAGVSPEAIVLDPGYGFGKRLRRELRAACPPGAIAGSRPAAACRAFAQVFPRPNPCRPPRRRARATPAARNRLHRRPHRRHPQRRFHRPRSLRPPRRRGRAYRRCHRGRHACLIPRAGMHSPAPPAMR